MNTDPATFAAAFAALYAAHQVGDHWIQTHGQSLTKSHSGWKGRMACAGHVASLTATKLAALALVALVVGLALHPLAVAGGLGVDAVSHYWADRRTPLQRLAHMAGKAEFYTLGSPRPGHNDNPHLGTGAYALDQSWHIGWLLITALIIATGT